MKLSIAQTLFCVATSMVFCGCGSQSSDPVAPQLPGTPPETVESGFVPKQPLPKGVGLKASVMGHTWAVNVDQPDQAGFHELTPAEVTAVKTDVKDLIAYAWDQAIEKGWDTKSQGKPLAGPGGGSSPKSTKPPVTKTYIEVKVTLVSDLEFPTALILPPTKEKVDIDHMADMCTTTFIHHVDLKAKKNSGAK